MRQAMLVLGAAIAGALLGFGICYLLIPKGFYALVLPGGLAGLLAGYLSNRSLLVAILCGLLALAAGICTEWYFFPFKRDESLQFFLLHMHDLSRITLALIAIGGAIGFAGPFRQWQRSRETIMTSVEIPTPTRENL